jgi:hypothetical protein
MSQNKYNVYGLGQRKSRHMGAPIPKEISSSVYATSMANALGMLMGELRGYEVEWIEVIRVYTTENARGPAEVRTMPLRFEAQDANETAEYPAADIEAAQAAYDKALAQTMPVRIDVQENETAMQTAFNAMNELDKAREEVISAAIKRLETHERQQRNELPDGTRLVETASSLSSRALATEPPIEGDGDLGEGELAA